jgi:hypothetical protein
MAITTNVEKNNTLANALDVKDNGQAIQVPRGNNNQLQWQLIGTANTLQFFPVDDPNYPAIKFVGSSLPPTGTFTNYTLLGNGNILQIDDNNPSGGGPWTYQLNAHDSMGVRYSTIATTLSATTNNPEIKNN